MDLSRETGYLQLRIGIRAKAYQWHRQEMLNTAAQASLAESGPSRTPNRRSEVPRRPADAIASIHRL